MKLLILGSFNKGALEQYYFDSFKRLDIELFHFDITADYFTALQKNPLNRIVNKLNPATLYQKVNDNLCTFLMGKHYDIILVFKGMFLFPNTVLQLKSHCLLLSCYNADHPYKIFSEGAGNRNIIDSIVNFDIYFSYSTQICKGLKELYGVNAFVIPFGFNDKVKFSRAQSQFEDKFVFIGAYDKARARQVESIEHDNLVVFGDIKWYTRTSRLKNVRRRYAGRSLYGQEYCETVGQSIGVLNFLREQNLVEGSHNMRTFEVPGYGGLLVSNRTEEQQEFFSEGKEAVFFDSFDELNDRLAFLQANAEIVCRMKEAATERCKRASYSYFNRSKQMLGIFSSFLR